MNASLLTRGHFPRQTSGRTPKASPVLSQDRVPVGELLKGLEHDLVDLLFDLASISAALRVRR